MLERSVSVKVEKTWWSVSIDNLPFFISSIVFNITFVNTTQQSEQPLLIHQLDVLVRQDKAKHVQWYLENGSSLKQAGCSQIMFGLEGGWVGDGGNNYLH